MSTSIPVTHAELKAFSEAIDAAVTRRDYCIKTGRFDLPTTRDEALASLLRDVTVTVGKKAIVYTHEADTWLYMQLLLTSNKIFNLETEQQERTTTT